MLELKEIVITTQWLKGVVTQSGHLEVNKNYIRPRAKRAKSLA